VRSKAASRAALFQKLFPQERHEAPGLDYATDFLAKRWKVITPVLTMVYDFATFKIHFDVVPFPCIQGCGGALGDGQSDVYGIAEKNAGE